MSTEEDIVRIAIIGAGQMGGYYANNLVNKCKVPARDIIVFDRIVERATALAQKYGTTVAEAFPLGADAAIVATNTPSHHDVVGQLTDVGVRHILVEKPLAQNSAGVRHIANRAENVNVYTALVINFSEALKYLTTNFMLYHKAELLEFYGRWGKNRGRNSEMRPTAGDLEDEAVHPIAVLLALANAHCRDWSEVRVSAQIGWLPYVNKEAQEKAALSDPSFPMPPNHSTSANLRLINDGQWLQASVHSSFLLSRETRLVGGVLGEYPATPRYAFEINFDQKRPEKTGGAADTLEIIDIAKGAVVQQGEFQSDKLADLTQAFLTAASGGFVDPRLVRLPEAKSLVNIAEAILKSDDVYGAPQTVDLS